MTIKELHTKLEQLIKHGVGDYLILMEGVGYQGEAHIDSIQKNTNINIDPDYYFIMAGGEYVENNS